MVRSLLRRGGSPPALHPVILGFLILCLAGCRSSADVQTKKALDNPCQLDLADVRERRLTSAAEREVKLIESFVNWRSTSLQGVTYDFNNRQILVTTDPVASRKEQADVEDKFRKAVSRSPQVAISFRPGCFSNSELAKAKDDLLAGRWLQGVNAAFAVSYDADDGHIRLQVDPSARRVASQAVVTYQPVLRLVQ